MLWLCSVLKRGRKPRQVGHDDSGIGQNAPAALQSEQAARLLLERQGFTLDGLLFHRQSKVVLRNLFGRNVSHFSIKSVVSQLCGKYKI